MKLHLAVLLALSQLCCANAFAWSRAGHMVSAAITYNELAAQDRQLVEEIMKIMAQHPDKGTFQVAVGNATGEQRNLRTFMEMARWPDDVRGGLHDHPTWHYSSSPLIDKSNPPPRRPADAPQGSAVEALALNLSVVADPGAPASERAVALCWLFHLVEDIHQPLHSVSLFSQRFPEGDRGGNLQFVRDPQSSEPVSLHWFWDDSISSAGEPELVLKRASELEQRLPRSQLSELRTPATPDFAGWTRESFEIAGKQVYTSDLATGDAAANARALSPRYLSNTTTVAERRLVLSSYRLADTLRKALGRKGEP